MKQPPTSRFRRKFTTTAAVLSTNLRLVCSFNGTFCLRPPFNRLKYIGGETRIVSVDRNIGISKLRFKFSDLSPELNSFTLKYKLSFPGDTGIDSDTCAPLVSVSSDDDVRRMIEDYEEMESYGKKIRLWIFVCRNDNGFENCGDEIESNDDLFGDFDRVKLDPVNVGVGKIRFSDESLRKSVLKQNLLAKQLEANDDLQDLSCRSEIEFSRFSDQPVEELYEGNMAVYKTQDAHLQGNYLHPLNPRDGNFKVEKKCCLNAQNCAWNSKYFQNSELNSNCDYGLKKDLGETGHGISQLNLKWENITLWAVDCPYKSQWSGNAYPETPQNCANDARNPRAYPYHVRNHRSKPIEKANNQIEPLNGKLSPHEIQQVPYQSFCEKYDTESITSELFTFDPYSSNGQEVEDSIDPTNIGSCSFSSYQTNGDAPQATSLLTSNDVSDSLVNTESKRSGLVDRELILVTKVDKAVQWNSSDCNSAAEQKDQSPGAFDGMSTGLVPIYTDLATQQLQTIKHSDLEYIKELGSGTYGTVFHGKWKGSDVAIKKIKPSCFKGGSLKDDRLVEDFWKEAKILGQLHHPNIVAFYGVVTDGPASNLATVTEYMVNGSLKQVLQRKDCSSTVTFETYRTIDRRKRIILAMDAAFGMEYIDEKNIVHFDLESHNLLVNMRDPRRPVCKIGDLGLSKVKQRTLVSGGVRGTIPWMAPELLNCENKMVTEKVDVFSFGIVMWELLTGEEPFSNLRSQELIGGIIKGSMRPEIPSWCDPAWKSLMERCWTSEPEHRPSFSEIAKELRTMAAEMNIK